MANDFEINDFILNRECQSIAGDLIEEYPDEEDRSDAIYQIVDGHQWVIYHHKALMLCAHCNTDWGDRYLEDNISGGGGGYDFLAMASLIAYGEMSCRIRWEMSTLLMAD
mgnify:CR=1 FL=1